MTKAHEKQHGAKTHAQQKAIINKEVDTSNGGAAFDAHADLTMPPEEHAARLRGATLDTTHAAPEGADDREMLRGEHQRSDHAKGHPDGRSTR